ncbi:polysaccharide deacetylase family protein [Flavivirga jejuensis]|uniref:Polysaccharide deacetylase family protein n=1 Tax=Flavivirga jejuensis TaxID=870487 RepID=A0ABT8WJA8_9FLAO|nr:polysaccharide deacetylase family protein [Flavivirga jejuensis]MDO5973245.1 polysaccharide deacetylase family protein [Flavivirga jejuensis]
MGIVKDILYKISSKRFLPVFKDQSIFPYYHIVRNNQVNHIEHLYSFKNKEQFLNDIDILSNNYRPLEPKELLENSIKKNTFLLSFDDGLKEVYTVIYPILKKKNIKAIFFINPNFIDNKEGLYKHYISIIISNLKGKNFEISSLDKISDIFSFSYTTIEDFKQKFTSIKYAEREKVHDVLNFLDINIEDYLNIHKPYITKEQIQEMIKDGFYFGGHTMGHPPLVQLSHEEQKVEIINSIDWLKQNFDINYSLFSFPFSDRSISKKLLEELLEYDNDIKIFGNSGLKKDMDERIIQRFSLENPNKQTEKSIVLENLYKYFNMVIGKYHIKRK